MNQITSDKDAGVKGHIEPGVGNTLHASQLQTMVKLYERIQTYIFRLMATDSVPKVGQVAISRSRLPMMPFVCHVVSVLTCRVVLQDRARESIPCYNSVYSDCITHTDPDAVPHSHEIAL